MLFSLSISYANLAPTTRHTMREENRAVDEGEISHLNDLSATRKHNFEQ
jgi:hypothetical protein